MLRIATDFSLPLEAVTQTFAILAKRGAGKTYTASVMAEEMLKAGQQVLVIDPTGAWWGLRSGFPVVVLGGDHGDVPLEDSAGEVIAAAAVEHRFPAILDVSLFPIRILLGGHGWIAKSDVGSAGPDTRSWLARLFGRRARQDGDRLKIAFSDALKRAAVKLGIGRYLNRIAPVWVAYDHSTRQFQPPKLAPSVLPTQPAGQDRPTIAHGDSTT